MNFQQILEKYNVEFKTIGQHHHAREGWIQFDCPFCGPNSRKYHAGYSIDGNYCNCWKCSNHGLVNTLMALIDEPYSVCSNLLNTIDRPRSRHVQRDEWRGRLQIPLGVDALQEPHKRYLACRGFDPEQIALFWGVQGIGLAKDLSWRLWIPVHYQGDIVSWTTRTIGQKGKRYISASPDQEKRSLKSLLYGADYARHTAIVCEGPTDVWRLGPGAIATLGLSYSMGQLIRISEYPIRVICFDNEKEAQKRARKLAADLSICPGETYVLRLESGGDVADADSGEVNEIRKYFFGVSG